MSEAEAAKFLNLNIRTLLRYRQSGKLPYREVQGKTRPAIEYDQADLDRLKATLEARRAMSQKPRHLTTVTTTTTVTTPRVSFGLSPAGYQELEAEAQKFGMSVGEYARRLTREGLESRFQSEATELRNRIKVLETELARTRHDFAAAFEVILEYTGLAPAEAQKWVQENLR